MYVLAVVPCATTVPQYLMYDGAAVLGVRVGRHAVGDDGAAVDELGALRVDVGLVVAGHEASAAHEALLDVDVGHEALRAVGELGALRVGCRRHAPS